MQSISFASGGDTVRRRRAGGRRPPVPCLDGALAGGSQVPQPLSPAPSPQDMTDYVAYVAKDPINQRGEAQRAGACAERGGCRGGADAVTNAPHPPACHILECCEGLAQSVISTVGQAFELRFKQYLHSPPTAVAPLERYGRPSGAWVLVSGQDPHPLACEAPLGIAPPPGHTGAASASAKGRTVRMCGPAASASVCGISCRGVRRAADTLSEFQ